MKIRNLRTTWATLAVPDTGLSIPRNELAAERVRRRSDGAVPRSRLARQRG